MAEVPANLCSNIVLESCMKGAANKIKGYYEKNEEELTKINELVSAKYGWTPLQVACGYGHDGAVKALLELGAMPNVPDKMGMTAMHAAADTDESSVMATLLATEAGKAAMNLQDSVRAPPAAAMALAGRRRHLGARNARSHMLWTHTRSTCVRTDVAPACCLHSRRMAARRCTMPPTRTATSS